MGREWLWLRCGEGVEEARLRGPCDREGPRRGGRPWLCSGPPRACVRLSPQVPTHPQGMSKSPSCFSRGPSGTWNR